MKKILLSITVLLVVVETGRNLVTPYFTAPTALPDIITDAAKKHNLDRTYLSCLLKIESEYRITAVSKTHDIGIGQINAHTAESFGMDIKRLTTDINYSVDKAAYMLAYYKWLKGEESRTWPCRYNVGPGPLSGYRAIACENYLERFYACTTGTLKGVL